MDWRKKLAIVVLIIGAGLALALQHRKPATSSNESAAAQDEAVSAATPATSTVPDAPSVTGTAPVAAPASPPTGIEAKITAEKSQLVDLNEPERTHTIADGDTLPKLAEHYLGSANRAADFFQYNRDLLPSMDVLPIGAELRIPPRIAVVDPQNPEAPPAVAVTKSAGPLVPLTQPAAQTTTPSLQPKHRTYTVQANDNLVDIARKFYGDGRKYQDLYEANRRTMKNPTDLKAGMVLIVP